MLILTFHIVHVEMIEVRLKLINRSVIRNKIEIRVTASCGNMKMQIST